MGSRTSLPRTLWIKSRLVGTPLEPIARRFRWIAGAWGRARHPEMWEVYLEDSHLQTALTRLVRRDWNCVDVGSHIGSFLASVLSLAPAGKHIAIEPSDEKSRWLAERFSNVEVHAMAVGAVKARQAFAEDIERPGYSRLGESLGDGKSIKTYEVDVTTLDDIVGERRVDLLKIDVEGGELEVLRGGLATIRRCRPVIVFECGSDYIDEVKAKRPVIFELLTETLNYEIHTAADFVFGKGKLGLEEFRRCGLYPFRAFNFIAVPAEHTKSATGAAGSAHA